MYSSSSLPHGDILFEYSTLSRSYSYHLLECNLCHCHCVGDTWGEVVYSEAPTLQTKDL